MTREELLEAIREINRIARTKYPDAITLDNTLRELYLILVVCSEVEREESKSAKS